MYVLTPPAYNRLSSPLSHLARGYVPLVPQTALCICSTATNTNRTLAWRRTAWLRSLWWWRTCERLTTNHLWLIKYTSFPFCCSSIWLLLGVKCAATKRSCSNLIKTLLSVGLIVFKVQLLQFFLVLSLHAISFPPILAL